MEKMKIYMEDFTPELVFYLEEKKKIQGKTLYKVLLKEEEQVKLFAKEVYEYFKTISYAYGFEVVEEDSSYSVSSEENKDFYETYLYQKMGDAFFETLMN